MRTLDQLKEKGEELQFEYLEHNFTNRIDFIEN